jgi:hypothetical protein
VRPGAQFGSIRRNLGLQLFEFKCQHGEALVDVVVKFSSDSGAFLLLGLNQSSCHVTNSVFCHLALGCIYALSKTDELAEKEPAQLLSF